MQPNPSHRWSARLGSFLIAASLAASITYWILQWPTPGPDSVALDSAVSSELPPPDVAAMARMMGASGPVETPPSTQQTLNLRLVGTVTYHDGHGAAIVSIDGKPAKTYIVGSVLENGWVLQSVERRKASFSATAQGPVVQTLEMALPRAGN